MESNQILISIVIPVKNGDKWINACIDGIMKQTLFPQTEIIVLDSGSTDNTLNILSQYPVKLFHIPSNEFNHGLTRNFGVEKSIGKYVVFTVQDARPADEFWLEKLLSGFKDDNVAGVCGAQVVPHEMDKNPVDWFRPVTAPELKYFRFQTKEEYLSLPPDQKKAIGGWDDVNAMYRRDIKLQLPFREIVYGEDALWVKDALMNGFTVCYHPGARVYHYHLEDFDYTFKRTLTAMHLRYKTFGYIPPKPSFDLKMFFGIIKILAFHTSGLSFGARLKWFRYNMDRFRGRRKAYYTFITALKEGEENLDRVHEKYCGQAPVPLRSINF